MAEFHICRPKTVVVRMVTLCPTCKTRRRMVASCTTWYSPIATCCTCGDSWSDGERLPRPFARGWRQQSSARARSAWRHAEPVAIARRRLSTLITYELAA